MLKSAKEKKKRNRLAVISVGLSGVCRRTHSLSVCSLRYFTFHRQKKRGNQAEHPKQNQRDSWSIDREWKSSNGSSRRGRSSFSFSFSRTRGPRRRGKIVLNSNSKTSMYSTQSHTEYSQTCDTIRLLTDVSGRVSEWVYTQFAPSISGEWVRGRVETFIPVNGKENEEEYAAPLLSIPFFSPSSPSLPLTWELNQNEPEHIIALSGKREGESNSVIGERGQWAIITTATTTRRTLQPRLDKTRLEEEYQQKQSKWVCVTNHKFTRQ